MSNLKKSFFGGYKRSSVDAEIDRLGRMIEEAEIGKKQLEHSLTNSKAKNDELNAQVASLSERVESLSEENALLKAQCSQNSEIFSDIAKIYKRAYGSGRDIVCDSKDTAKALLEALRQRFDLAMGDTADIIEKYETIQKNISQTFNSLKNDMAAVADSTELMMKKAKKFAGIYNEMNDTIKAASKDGEKALAEFDAKASEFLTPENDDAEDVTSLLSRPTAKETELTEEPDESMKEKPDKTNSAPQKRLTLPRRLSRIVNRSKKSGSPDEATHNIPDNRIPIIKTAHTATGNKVSENADAENTAPENEVKIQPAVTKMAVGDTSNIPENQHTFTDDEQQSISPVKKLPESDNQNSDFTQFGRKSKISAEDRNELLRKALLKNGGNN